MTPLGLTVFRRTAALAHAVPGLRVRLRHNGAVLLDVMRPSHPAEAPVTRWISPCAFRMAVGRAVAAVDDGRPLAVLGLAVGVDPAVDVGVSRGVLLPGGIAELPTPSGTELAFATTVDPVTVAALATDDSLDVRCHPDPVTRASVVVHRVGASARSIELATAREATQDLLARCAATELLDELDVFLRVGEARAGGPAPQRDRPPRQ